MTRLLSVREAASVLGISPDSVRALLRSGKIRGTPAPVRLRIDPNEIEAWLEHERQRPAGKLPARVTPIRRAALPADAEPWRVAQQRKLGLR